MTTPTHITSSGGLISAAFIENIRELGTRQRGIEPESFGLPWSEAPKSPAALEETIATAWELLKERWDAVYANLRMMDLSQVCSRWLLPLLQLLDFDPGYLRGDTVLDETGELRYPLSHRGWEREEVPFIHTVIPSQDLDTPGWAAVVESKPSHPTTCSRPSSTPAGTTSGQSSPMGLSCACCATIFLNRRLSQPCT